MCGHTGKNEYFKIVLNINPQLEQKYSIFNKNKSNKRRKEKK